MMLIGEQLLLKPKIKNSDNVLYASFSADGDDLWPVLNIPANVEPGEYEGVTTVVVTY